VIQECSYCAHYDSPWPEPCSQCKAVTDMTALSHPLTHTFWCPDGYLGTWDEVEL